MTLNISTIKPKKGSTKTRRRVGRGNASGIGTYSGKGQKGQRSRSGVSGLKRMGMKQMLLRTPKRRGFNSPHPKNVAISFNMINKYYEDGETVNLSTLKQKDVIGKNKTRTKLLLKGSLTVKKLIFENIQMSKTAEAHVKKAGCKIDNKKTEKKDEKKTSKKKATAKKTTKKVKK